MNKEQIREEIQKLLYENYGNLGIWSDFDRNKMNGEAMRAAMQDMKSAGEEFTPLGKSKFDKDLNIEDMISDLELAKLNLPKDSKKMNVLQHQINHLKRMGAGSLNESQTRTKPITNMTFDLAKEMFEFLDSNGEHALVSKYKGVATDTDLSGIIGAWATTRGSLEEILDDYWKRHKFIYKNRKEAFSELEENINIDGIDTTNLYKFLQDGIHQMLSKGMNEAQIAQTLENALNKHFVVSPKNAKNLNEEPINEYYTPSYEDYADEMQELMDPAITYTNKEFVNLFGTIHAILHSREMNKIADELRNRGFDIEKDIEEGIGISQTIKNSMNAKPTINQEGIGISKTIKKGMNIKPTKK